MTPYKTKLTKEELQKWTARLRDPNSKQAVGFAYRLPDGSKPKLGNYETKGDEAMCCLVHGQHVLEGRALVGDWDNDYWYFFESRGVLTGPLAAMNDEGKTTLPQIADWIDANLLPADVL